MRKRFFKFFVLISFAVIMLLTFSLLSNAVVYTGSCGEELTYVLDTDYAKLTIEGRGRMTDFASANDVPWRFDGAWFTKVELPSEITSIGDYAFYNSGIVEIVIPDKVDVIGKSAFMQCTSLSKITLPTAMESIGEYAFANCFQLGTFKLPEGITTIENGTFHRCESLSDIETNGDIISVGDYAFYECKELKAISFSDDLSFLGKECFRYCSNLESLYIDSLEGWLNVKITDYHSHPIGKDEGKLHVDGILVEDIVIPDGVDSIGNYAFKSCCNIAGVTIGENIKSIGAYSFFRCKGLINVDISDSVTALGYYAFGECLSLTGVVLPSSLEKVASYSFSCCESLEYVTLKSGIKEIGFCAFDNCTSLESVEIPEGVTLIDDQAFEYCSSLCSVSIPKSLESIGRNAFYGVSVDKLYITDVAAWLQIELYDPYSHPLNEVFGEIFVNGVALRTVIIPDTVKRINSFAFYGCKGIESVRFHRNVESVGTEAFAECTNLTEVMFLGRNTEITIEGFYNCENLKKLCLFRDSLADAYFSEEHYSKVYLYEIVFDANGGENAPEPIIKLEDDSVNIAEAFPKKENCLFDGWAVEPDGDAVYYPGDVYVANEDITLYAKWKNKTAKVYLIDSITDEVLDSFDVNIGDIVAGFYDVEKYGYTFDGWFTDKYSGEEVNYEYVVEDENDLYFYARFSEIHLNSVGIPLGELLYVYVGESVILEVNLFPENALNKNLIWSSSDPNVATVDEFGKVTAVAFGVADITVSPVVGSGSATCRIVVKEEEPNPDAPIVGLGSLRAPAKGTIEIPLYLSNVSGISTLDVTISYDHDIMSLMDIKSESGILRSGKNHDTENKVVLSFDLSGVTERYCTVCYLVFKLKPEAEYRYYDLSILSNEAIDKSNTEMQIYRKHGGIFVVESMIGDVNFDGEIGVQDAVLLAQYLAKWDVNPDLIAADCNADGIVDTRDAVLLAQYLAKWDVTLGK